MSFRQSLPRSGITWELPDPLERETNPEAKDGKR
jgi:hypothetical protein